MWEAKLVQEVIRAGYYSHPDEDICGCHGSGWILHPCDVFVECPTHRGRPHPLSSELEDEEEE